MLDFGVLAVDIAFEGEVSKLNVKPLSAAALAGVLRPMLAEVNMVSAPAVAKERGITVSESRQEDSPIYESLMRITVTTEKGKRSFAGTVLAGAPRVVEVKGMDLDAPFAPRHALRQQPGQAGLHRRAGRPLGEAGVNIATFNLGPHRRRRRRHRLVGVDQEPTPAPAEEDPGAAAREGSAVAGVLSLTRRSARRRSAARRSRQSGREAPGLVLATKMRMWRRMRVLLVDHAETQARKRRFEVVQHLGHRGPLRLGPRRAAGLGDQLRGDRHADQWGAATLTRIDLGRVARSGRHLTPSSPLIQISPPVVPM
jgi:hypothetical protein